MNDSKINRVPVVILSYWIIKIAATTLGETGADYFSHTLKLGYTLSSAIFIGLLIIFFSKKLLLKKYTPISYWLTFVVTSLTGTTISDLMDRTLGLGYLLGSIFLIVMLLIILLIWYVTEKSISVELIYTNRSEYFYWIAFLISNTLGTALGDYLADDLSFGFAKGTVVIGALLMIIVFLHFFSKLSKTFLFWIAFVLTRPFGATFGDLLSKPYVLGGANFGTVGASTFFLIILILLIFRENKKHNQVLRSLKNAK